MLNVYFTIIQPTGGYFDSAFGNWLPDEEEVEHVVDVSSMEEFEENYPYYERILKVEEVK